MATYKDLVNGQTVISIAEITEAYSLLIRQGIRSGEIIRVLKVFQEVVAQGRVR